MLAIIAIDENGIEELEPVPYEWEVAEFQDTTPPTVTIERAPPTDSERRSFEFIGSDDMTPPQLLIYECRVDSTNELDWQECISPFSLLDLYTYEDPQMAPGPAHVRGPGDRPGRAARPELAVEGNVGRARLLHLDARSPT